MSEREKVLPVKGMSVEHMRKAHCAYAKGARNAETEIVRLVQRGCQYRATQQFARVAIYQRFPSNHGSV